MSVMMQGYLSRIGCSTLILSALFTFFLEAQRLPCHRSYLMMAIILGLGLRRMVGMTAPEGYCAVLFLHSKSVAHGNLLACIKSRFFFFIYGIILSLHEIYFWDSKLYHTWPENLTHRMYNVL